MTAEEIKMEPSARASAPNKSAVQSVNAMDGSMPMITQEDFPGNTQTKPSGAPPFQSESTGQGADVPLRDGAPLGAPGGAPTSESIAQLGG